MTATHKYPKRTVSSDLTASAEPAALDGKWKNPPLEPESGKPK